MLEGFAVEDEVQIHWVRSTNLFKECAISRLISTNFQENSIVYKTNSAEKTEINYDSSSPVPKPTQVDRYKYIKGREITLSKELGKMAS